MMMKKVAAVLAAGLIGTTAFGAELVINGSTTVLPIVQKAAESYSHEAGAAAISLSGGGSGNGIKALIDGLTTIAMSSRDIKASEAKLAQARGVKPVRTAVAVDAIVPVVNNANPVKDITLATLKAIYEGKIRNWKDVGGDDGEIVLVGREAGSGTRDGFESIVDVKDSCKYAQELTATGAVISAVEANPLAIGYASLSAIGDTVKAVTVGGVECSEETVKDGSYEVQRPFVFVTNDSVTLSAQAQAFFDFATSTDAADLIRTAGAVPVNE